MSFPENQISGELQSEVIAVLLPFVGQGECLRMKRINKTLTFCTLAMFVFALSCGHPMSLQSITVSPSSSTVSPPGANIPVQYTAYGSFIHPTETLDITKDVTWTSAIQDVATVGSNTGLVIPGLDCGTTIITATAGKGVVGPGSSDIIEYGTATFTVTNNNDPTCGGSSEPVLTVSTLGTGVGTITGPSTGPANINCTTNLGGICAAVFPTGTQVTLTEAPAPGSTFIGWTNCTPTSATQCTVTVTNSLTVTAQFN
jgi:uncharacterized protein YjdB